MSEIIKINLLNPEINLLKKAKRVLESGGIIGYPTDTVYGIGANAFDEKAIRKVFSLKKREFSKPILLVIPLGFDLEEIVSEIPEQALKLIKAFWPGPLTIVFKANKELPSILTNKTESVGIRVPDNPITLKLLSFCNFPITSTSANPSGMPSAKSASQVNAYFGDKLDLIIDSGHSSQTKPSTIVGFSKNRLKIVRQGIISPDRILNALTK